MICEQFTQWARSEGLARVAEMVSEYERERGRKGVTYQAIQDWINKGIPPARVLCVEALSGIPRHVLRPDIYPPESAGNAA